MSKKKDNDTSSKMPSGEFQWTSADNYGLDTFYHDMEVGQGVKEQRIQMPQIAGVADLPGNFLTEESKYGKPPLGPSSLRYGMLDLGADQAPDLVSFLEEGKAPRIPAIDWLEVPEDFEDPRRPQNPHNRVLRELEEAWGVHRRTDGRAVMAPGAAYPQGNEFRLSPVNLDLDYVRYQDQVENGIPIEYRFTSDQLETIVNEAFRKSASGVPLAKVLIETAGYLEGEAFRVKEAMLQLRDEHGLAGKVFVRAEAYPGCHDGKWNDHLHKVAGGARYVVAASKCRSCRHNSYGRCNVLQRKLVASVPWREALEEYKPQLELSGVKTAGSDPREILRQGLARQARTITVQDYHEIEDPTIVRLDQKVRANRYANAESELAEVQTRVVRERASEIAQWLKQAAEQGTITAQQARIIFDSSSSLREAQTRVASIMAKGSVKTQTRFDESYSMPTYKANFSDFTDRERYLMRIASDAGVAVSEVHALENDLLQAMNRGMAGDRLDEWLSHRYAHNLRTAASSHINGLRRMHEGLAGFLYVDATAYGRDCDQGAHIHSRSNVPYVKKMAACDGCGAQSGGVCGKYRKPLVGGFDNPQALEAYRRETIRQANTVPVENIASVQAPVENPVDAYGLANDSMEGFDYFKQSSESLDVDFGYVIPGDEDEF